MKFDLSWFTTIPGILITCGVVLLILALVIFIVTSKKNKKVDENKEEKKDAVEATATATTAAPIEIDSTPLQDIGESDMAVPIEVPAEPVAVTDPIVGAAEIPVMDVTPTPVAEPTPTSVVEPTPTPVVEPTPAPVVEPAPAPVVEPTPAPVVEPATTPVAEEKPAIYGGVSQIIPNIDLSKKEEHQIYGGADPLENTQTLTVTPSVTEPVAKVEEAPVTIPSVTPVSEEPQPTVSVIPAVPETKSNDIDSLMP